MIVNRSPRVTVLMPVFNASGFLREALESILSQSYIDFEFLIIDDGSTDESLTLIQSFDDKRIRLIRNSTNMGVATTLNKGLGLSRGEYIARMDADDISLPLRLEKQVAYLDAHPEVSVIGVAISLIDNHGNKTGSDDRETITGEQIVAMLPKKNCIAHPGVMIRRTVAERFGYHAKQHNAEDYDLWLRLVADRHRIEKLEEILLQYRVHKDSITYKSNQSGCELKDIRTRALFLAERLMRFSPVSPFVLKVTKHLVNDVMHLIISKIRVLLFALARKSLIQAGMLFGSLIRKYNNSKIFFFFPFFHVGGAERVHSDIVSTVADRKPWIFITNRSKNDAFRFLFREKGRLFDLSPLLPNLFFKHLITGFLSNLINRHKGCVVFGANSPFFYDLAPHLHNSVKCIDLLHAFGGGLEFVSLPHISRLDRRVVINRKTIDDLREQYEASSIPPLMLERISVIENMVSVPPQFPEKGAGRELNVIYVGRNGEEKRVHIVGRIARLCYEHKLPLSFTLIGDVLSTIRIDDRRFCKFTGEVVDYEKLSAIYRNADIILLTSRSEGFPMVIMEAMAHGVVPICTNVGGIDVHISHSLNGFLVSGDMNEENMAIAFMRILEKLQTDRQFFHKISVAAYSHSKEFFSGAAFRRNYRSLFGLHINSEEVSAS